MCFCAVKTLEPNFYDCNNIEEQIRNVDIRFGMKKHLLIMDNNILYSKELDNTVDKIRKLGFGTNNNKIKKNSNMKYYLDSINARLKINKNMIIYLIELKMNLLISNSEGLAEKIPLYYIM